MPDIDTEIAEIEEVISNDSNAYFKDANMQARYGELMQAKEFGTAPPPVGRDAERIAEIEKDMAGPGNSSKYWHDEGLQAEYKQLLAGESAPSEVAEALGVSEDMAADFMARVHALDDEIGDTADIAMAFMGLRDSTQVFVRDLLIDPSQKMALFDQADDATLEEFNFFVESLPEHEWAAVQKALIL